MTTPAFRHPPGSHLGDLAKLLSERWGRRVCWRLLFEYGVIHHPSANLDVSVDGLSRAMLTYHAEGARSVGRAFEQDLQKADLEAYTLMITEGYAEAAAAASASEPSKK